jgi:hypothetical protein
MSPAEDYYNRVVLGLVKDFEGNLHSFQVPLSIISEIIIQKM